MKICTNIFGGDKESQLQALPHGMEGHIHIFSDLHPSILLADYIKDIKVSSSVWMKERGLFPNFKGWQDGYGTFTYSAKE